MVYGNRKSPTKFIPPSPSNFFGRISIFKNGKVMIQGLYKTPFALDTYNQFQTVMKHIAPTLHPRAVTPTPPTPPPVRGHTDKLCKSKLVNESCATYETRNNRRYYKQPDKHGQMCCYKVPRAPLTTERKKKIIASYRAAGIPIPPDVSEMCRGASVGAAGSNNALVNRMRENRDEVGYNPRTRKLTIGGVNCEKNSSQAVERVARSLGIATQIPKASGQGTKTMSIKNMCSSIAAARPRRSHTPSR